MSLIYENLHKEKNKRQMGDGSKRGFCKRDKEIKV
jgi:hypothetical protein